MRLGFDPVDPQVLSPALDMDVGQNLTAQDLWLRLRPRLAEFGISRMADITGLDHIGLPVVQAVRPRARSNAVTQGKASATVGAAVGAALECLEMMAGECLDHLPVVEARNPDIWRALAPGLPAGTIWPDAQSQYIAAWDLSNDRLAALPRDLISTDFSQDAEATQAPILRHSIGLGAGTTYAAALMHGLLECIEADARLRAEFRGGARRLALCGDDPTYGPVLGLIKAAGLRVAAYDLPCRGGVIAVKASIMDAPGASTLPLPAAGYGARTNQSDAIAAALSEAAQARLAVISGAREDITQRFYNHNVAQADLQAEWERHAPVDAWQGHAPTAAPNLRQLVARVGPVFAVPLFYGAQIPLAITRIVAPDLIADPLRLEAP